MLANCSPDRGLLLVVVGPTGVGKTAFSMMLANDFGGEIISADSRLLYRGMNIGTDKPSASDQALVPHHLVDVCQPDETITLAQYKRLADAAIADVHRRENLPLLVGGTGQYVKAIVEGWSIPEIAPKIGLREALQKLGGTELYRWLAYLDPSSAKAIEVKNVRRVIRALEVTLISGQPMSQLRRKEPPPYDIKMIGLTCDREVLYKRIDERVDRMMADGLVEEVEGLKAKGYSRALPAMSGLGYRQIMAYLEDESSLAASVERIKFETHRFARQQHNWFRPDDDNIDWYDIQQLGWQARAIQDVKRFLSWPGNNALAHRDHEGTQRCKRRRLN
ncbi:MAG TPA: tRNA (adenosine(37)-N6)-dimethylallyltransferase MiaA [Anaerolineae bacterium]|jgi:tRNA dimethylallyltransferase|nr:tRNA (adenosine(37)-N6)-dimethylallyltransferase MiaA [Anaerolineae bacterium]